MFYVSSVRKHKFQKQYKIHDYTCSECKTAHRDSERAEAKELEEQKMRELADKQNELFERTRQEMEAHGWREETGRLSELQRQEQEINEQARVQAQEYFANHPEESTFDQVFLTYKFMLTPSELLVGGMECKSAEDIKRYFRNIAKLLHPDKNGHPSAKDAFQKLLSAVSKASRRS